jgi:hypothetical protein
MEFTFARSLVLRSEQRRGWRPRAWKRKPCSHSEDTSASLARRTYCFGGRIRGVGIERRIGLRSCLNCTRSVRDTRSVDIPTAPPPRLSFAICTRTPRTKSSLQLMPSSSTARQSRRASGRMWITRNSRSCLATMGSTGMSGTRQAQSRRLYPRCPRQSVFPVHITAYLNAAHGLKLAAFERSGNIL